MLLNVSKIFDELDSEQKDYARTAPGQLLPIGDPTLDLNLEFNIRKTILEVLEQTTITPVDVRVDDRDFATAPNFYTFATNTNFLNITPYVPQAAIATIAFSEYCPRCSDLDFVYDFSVSNSLTDFERKMCLLEEGVCPSCGARKSELVKSDELNFYQEMAVNAGQRSGKSAITAMMAAYLIHRVLKLQNPNSVYGLLSNSVLHGTFVALTYAQAKDTLWEPLYGYLMSTPWFSEYHDMLKMYGEKYGEDLVKLNDTFVLYRHRRVLCTPSGPDKRTLRGRTRFYSSVDELGWFDNSPESKKVKMGATEVYTALERSLLTVRASSNKLLKQGFDNIPTGMFLNISSPSGRRDKIMELVRKAQGSKKIYGISRPTWEMNPTVTKEDLAEEFRLNPTMAMRDYGAEPPLAANPFIESKDMVRQCYRKVRNKVRIQHRRRKAKDGTLKRYARITECTGNKRPSVMAIDAGYSNNSFACVVAKLVKGPTMAVDAMVEVIPLPSIPLNYTLIYNEIISPLIEKFNVKVLAADRWNSLKILSDAEIDHDVMPMQHSVRYSAFWDFKQKMEEGSFVFPRPYENDIDLILEHNPDEYPVVFENSPADHFVLQCLTVQDSGTAVLKGEGGLTDDLFRATVLASDIMGRDEVLAQLLLEDEPMTEERKKSLGVMRSYGSGATGGVSVGNSSLGVFRRRR